MAMSLFPVYLMAVAGAAATGLIFKPGAWYASLNKPAWTPPGWAFPVVWTLLYLAMAVAAARVGARSDNGAALGFWSIQIVLNTLWTPVFFGARQMQAGLLVIGLLWLAVLGTTILFFAADTLAGWLFVPYLAWVTLATALNASIVRRNPQV